MSSYRLPALGPTVVLLSSKATTRSSKATTHIIHLISKRRPAARRPFVGSGPGKANLASARPGDVWAPTGGSGHFLALKISKGARAYGQIGGYGLRWPRLGVAGGANGSPAVSNLSLNL